MEKRNAKIEESSLQENKMDQREQVNLWLKEGKTKTWIAKQFGIARSTLNDRITRWEINDAEKKVNVKSGVETRQDDRVIINWTTRTVITDLGEFGSYSCSFDTHGAIQREYVVAYEGRGRTSAEVATQFDFAHAKAVLLYAKLHGFTKASVPQTDLEFEEGLTPEEASDETLQSLKRRTLRMTERKKWVKVQADADKWNNFDINVLKPTADWVGKNLPKYKAPLVKLREAKEPYAGVVGVSDWHFMKQTYDKDWNSVYDKEKAIQILTETNNSLISQMSTRGRPDVIYLPVGTDNLHVDNPEQMTTKGTEQGSCTDGDWAGSLQEYVDVTIAMVEMFSQIAPVQVIVIPGNHDNHTSELLGVLLATLYEEKERVTVNRSHWPRHYFRYGNTCMGFAHGDGISLPKLKRSLHQFILVEAKEYGVDISSCTEFLFFTGHVHYDSFEDLGGVKHFVIPSLSGTDEWHRSSGYVGSKKESAIYIVDKVFGRRAIYYS